MSKTTQFPSHLIDPREKDKKWVLKYLKAAYNEYNIGTHESFFNKAHKYNVISSYAHGSQPINKYKPMMGEEEKSDNTWLSINWEPVPIFSKYRKQAIARLMKTLFNVEATPIDSLAQDEKENYFKDQEARIKIRQAMKSVDPELLELSPFQKKEGEVDDIEELYMQKNFTYKHRMASEIEQALDLILATNNYSEIRQKIIENLFDYGVSVVKEDIDSNGAIKITSCRSDAIVLSYCSDSTFKDLQHIGQIKEYTISELKEFVGTELSTEQYLRVAESVAGKYGNPRFPINYTSAGAYDSFKVHVLDMEFFSVNEMVHQKKEDKRGNTHISKTSYHKDGMRTAFKVVYKGSWVIGTDIGFKCGLATNMKRKKSTLMDTSMSYHVRAVNFNNMNITGVTEKAIPIIDMFQLAWYKYQQAVATARPKGVAIEIGALEDIALGKGGEALKPIEAIDLFEKKGTLVYRRINMEGDVANYDPIKELGNGIGDEAIRWFNVLQQQIELMKDITGLNELTDASTPDPRTLTTTAELAVVATSNALWDIENAERELFKELCEDLVLRIQDVVKKNGLSGYKKALGSETIEFFKASDKLSMHEYGIEITNMPTEQERNQLIGTAKAYEQAGLLEFTDVILIKTHRNLKIAEQILAWRIDKRKKAAQEEAIMNQRMNAETQQQSTLVSEQAKQETEKVKSALKIEEIKTEKDLELRNAIEIAKINGQITNILTPEKEEVPSAG